jgi:hypothetical protein
VPGLGTLALRIDSDLVAWPLVDGKRRQVKSPVWGGRYFGLILLFEIDTGRLQFAAAATVAYRQAQDLGLGRDLPDEWFLQTGHS